ncbi:helix-turn-helix domain-containing protein [Glutamicibacter nicotianae]|uniref:helix-turn-helix domain-containing protein n=1 Tax=Glutamicibacter nicotianae TaxID=37929 RepID=UPI00195D5E68|nr:helix-turn-helix transcriptional regulator [Glutamicibacter nicotianae]MBM7767376.1 transcriptional regulator with XRE-family HTH domain [Glutamicibacter nicotianae]
MNEELNRVEARAESLVDVHTDMLSGLVNLRKEHKLSQASVAERMGVSQPTVAAFEHYDSNPTLATIRRYALAVGARLEIAVVDDCVENTESDFEAIVATLKSNTVSFKARGKTGSGSRWGTPKTAYRTSVIDA